MKKIPTLILVLSSILFTGVCFAQFSTVWNSPFQHTTSPGFSNEGRKIAKDPTGNIFVLSDVTSDINPSGTQGTITYHYVTLAKYATTGSLVNKVDIDIQGHIVSGNNNLSAFGLEVDASGNVYIGYSIYDAIADFDIQLVMYDNNLNRVWANTFSTPGSDVGIDFNLQSTGTVHAVVKSTDLGTTYSVIQSVPGATSANRTYSFALNGPVINSIDVDDLTTAYVAGYSMKGGHKNAYLASINVTLGSMNWESIYTAPGIAGDDVANKITIGVDGNIYTIGNSYQGPGQLDNVLVLKNLPGSDRFEFVKVLRGVGVVDKGLFINATENGWLYLGTISGNKAIVYRFESSGSFISPGMVTYTPSPTSAFTAINGITLTDMEVSSSKNIYITGGVSATGPSGDFTSIYFYKTAVVFGNALVRAGTIPEYGDFNLNFEGIDLALDYGKTDIYWLRNYWDDTHNIETVELLDLNVPSPLRKASAWNSTSTANGLSMHPNPAKETVKFESQLIIKNVEIFDCLGNLVLVHSAYSEIISFDVSFLVRGIYICKVYTDEGETVQKLIIE